MWLTCLNEGWMTECLLGNSFVLLTWARAHTPIHTHSSIICCFVYVNTRALCLVPGAGSQFQPQRELSSPAALLSSTPKETNQLLGPHVTVIQHPTMWGAFCLFLSINVLNILFESLSELLGVLWKFREVHRQVQEHCTSVWTREADSRVQKQ